MEPMLVTLAFVSLALACGMSIVAWKLLKDRHDRSAARVEALQAMAFGDSTADAVDDRLEEIVTAPSPVRDRARHAPRERPHAREAAIIAPAAPVAAAWDVALGETSAREAASARELGTMAPVIFDPAATSAPPSSAAARRWMAVAAVALVLAAAVATTYALRTPEIVAAMAASRPAHADAPLELLSLQHHVEANGGFQVTGLVQNPANGVVLKDVVAVVYLFDEQGNYFATARAVLNMGQVAPGDEAPFVVSFPNAVGVGRYRVGFRYDHGGGVVAHVDHRSQMSGSGTSSAEPADAPAPAAAPRRSEG